MIAEGTQPPACGRECRPRPGSTSDILPISAVDSTGGITGRPPTGRTTADPEGGAERAVAEPKPRMRGWLHAAVFPLSPAGDSPAAPPVVYRRGAAAGAVTRSGGGGLGRR